MTILIHYLINYNYNTVLFINVSTLENSFWKVINRIIYLTFQIFIPNSLTSIHSWTIDLIFYISSVNHWDSSFAIMACFLNKKDQANFCQDYRPCQCIFFIFSMSFFVTQLKFVLEKLHQKEKLHWRSCMGEVAWEKLHLE